VNGSATATLNLKDMMGGQAFELDFLSGLDAKKPVNLKFEISGIYPGNKRADHLCISELYLDCKTAPR